MYRRKLLRVAAALPFASAPSFAQDAWPSKPVRIIVPFAAGSGVDVIARTVAQKMAENMRQQFVIDNRPGVNGALGTDAAAKAAPDGYTIILGGTGNFAINMSLYSKLPYDSQRDFTPVAIIGDLFYFLVSGSKLPANSVGEFLTLAKAKPGQRTIAYASASTQMAAELFKFKVNANLRMIPYKSLSQVVLDLASGEVDVGFLDSGSAYPHIQPGGRLKALAVTTTSRDPLLPTVPTFAESGYPAVATTAWIAYFAPAGTPQEIVAKLHSEIVRAAQTPEVLERLRTMGGRPAFGGPEKLGEVLKEEVAKWDNLFKEAKLPRNN